MYRFIYLQCLGLGIKHGHFQYKIPTPHIENADPLITTIPIKYIENSDPLITTIPTFALVDLPIEWNRILAIITHTLQPQLFNQPFV